MKSKVIHNKNNNIYGKNSLRKQNLNMFLPLGILVLLTIISFFTLSSSSTSAEDGGSNATDNTSADIGVNVALACTLSGNSTTHAVTLNNGSYNDNITGTTLHTICNGSGNYNIYAIGYTNNTDGDNVLDGGSSGTIPTGTTLDGKVSNWAMKLANSTGNTATIENGYSGFNIIPSTSTLVASYNATSSQTTDSTLQTTYGISISPNQPAGTYTGQVKYTMEYSAYTPYYMWEATSANCGLTLHDNRDGTDREYTTAKINGLCWMTTNLALGADTEVELTSATSNVSPSGYTLPASSTRGFDNGNNLTYIYNSGNTNCGDGSPCYGYYTYAAATAGMNPDSGDSEYDICPAGWRLPTRAEFIAIKDIYTTGPAIVAEPFLGAYAGIYFRSSFSDGGSLGRYQSATSSDDSYAYGLNFTNTNANANRSAKTIGASVRCVAKS